MEEKAMVNYILAGIKNSLTTYQTAITETENTNLRQTLQQIRNNDDSFPYDIFKAAQAKGYYKPAMQATPQEVTQVKNELQA